MMSWVNFEELALLDTLDMGAPLSCTRGMKSWLSQTVLFYASQTAAASAETLKNSMPGSMFTMKLKAPVGGGLDPNVGFGGYKMSGYGWKGAKEHVDSFLYQKAVYINLDD